MRVVSVFFEFFCVSFGFFSYVVIPTSRIRRLFLNSRSLAALRMVWSQRLRVLWCCFSNSPYALGMSFLERRDRFERYFDNTRKGIILRVVVEVVMWRSWQCFDWTWAAKSKNSVVGNKKENNWPVAKLNFLSRERCVFLQNVFSSWSRWRDIENFVKYENFLKVW